MKNTGASVCLMNDLAWLRISLNDCKDAYREKVDEGGRVKNLEKNRGAVNGKWT